MTHTLNKKAGLGFTIVEVIVVIVVIGIIAGISVVSYQAVTDSARKQAAKTDAQTVAALVNKYKADKGSYPADLNAITLPSGVTSTFQYTYNREAATFCVTATVNNTSAYVKSGSTEAKEGGCPGHSINGGSTVTNLIPNPAVRTAVTGWAVGAAGSTGTQARVATGGPEGVADSFYRRTNTAAATSSPITLITTSTGLNAIPVEASTQYTASIYARSSCVVSAGLRVDYAAYNSTGASVGSAGGALVKNTANTWVRVSYTFTTGADVAYIRPYISFSGPTVCPDDSTFDATAAMLTKTDRAYSYGDGDSPNWIWNGTPSNSTSTGPAQ